MTKFSAPATTVARKTIVRASLAVLAAAALLPVVACGPKDKPAEFGGNVAGGAMSGAMSGAAVPGGSYGQPGYPATYGQPTGYPTQPGAPGGYPTQPGAPTGYPTQPGAPTGQPTASGGPPNPFDLGGLLAQGAQVLGGGAVPGMPGHPAADPQTALKAGAPKWAPGMSPEGEMASHNLQEGGHAYMMITMQAGKCYTIIAQSSATLVRDVNLSLLAPPLYNMPAGSSDGHDPTAIIGKGSKPQCPITPFPLQYKLDIAARAGSGQVVVQVFSKPK